MPPLIALALGTSIWGFALQPPMSSLSSTAPGQIARVQLAAIDPEPYDLRSDAERERDAATHTRMDVLRGLQLATNLSLAATFTLATIVFADRWGFHENASQTACANGTAVLGYCQGDTPWANFIAAGATGALGGTSFILWTQTDIERARQLDHDWSTYEVTRVVGRVMNIIGAIWGLLHWNATDLGWADEQGDYDTLQAIGVAHMAWGAATLALDTANTALLF